LGPTGSLELQYHLWRRKIKLFGQARFAFVVQSLEASASFVTFVNSSGTTLVTPATLESETDRATWNLGVELGAAWRVADGFSVELAYSSNRYQSVLYLPTELYIPQFAEQIPQGTTALYDTADIETSALRISLGFQF
jgi:hypothetical protein